MIKVSLYLDVRRVNTNGESVMKIRLTHNRKTAYISTSIKVVPSMWNGRKVINSPTLTNIINMYYDRIRGEVARLELTGQFTTLNITQIRDRVLKEIGIYSDIPQKHNFIQYYKDFANSRKASKTKDRYLTLIKHFESYDSNIGHRDLVEIDSKWTDGLHKYLLSIVGNNSASIYLSQLKTMFNFAVEEEIILHNPMSKWKPHIMPTFKRALTIDQLRRLFNVSSLSSKQECFRDYFMLIFYLCGINVADLSRIKEIQGGRIEYFRSKTGKPISIKVEPEAINIIQKYKGKKYLIDILDTYQDYDVFSVCACAQLKTIKDELGIICPKLSPYWARHTWATIAAELDIPKETIAAALSHGERTITDVYITFNLKKIDDANRRIIDYVLHDKK